MRKIFLMVGMIGIGIACQKTDVAIEALNKEVTSTNSIIGKWSPTYIQKAKINDVWSDWQVINTFAALAVLEFTADGKFLMDGKSGASCCTTGNKYQVNSNVVTFSELKTDECAAVLCYRCDNWQVESLKGDTLVLNQCYVINKYVRIK